jgi:hypothetical protein
MRIRNQRNRKKLCLRELHPYCAEGLTVDNLGYDLLDYAHIRGYAVNKFEFVREDEILGPVFKLIGEVVVKGRYNHEGLPIISEWSER